MKRTHKKEKKMHTANDYTQPNRTRMAYCRIDIRTYICVYLPLFNKKKRVTSVNV